MTGGSEKSSFTVALQDRQLTAPDTPLPPCPVYQTPSQALALLERLHDSVALLVSISIRVASQPHAQNLQCHFPPSLAVSSASPTAQRLSAWEAETPMQMQ